MRTKCLDDSSGTSRRLSLAHNTHCGVCGWFLKTFTSGSVNREVLWTTRAHRAAGRLDLGMERGRGQHVRLANSAGLERAHIRGTAPQNVVRSAAPVCISRCLSNEGGSQDTWTHASWRNRASPVEVARKDRTTAGGGTAFPPDLKLFRTKFTV